MLKRSVGTSGAILMGLGSILGTGLFVSLAIATEVAGTGVLVAIVIAAALAAFNGLSSAQLAAAYPVSGGTYEYGYRVLGPNWGFTAGWMFMLAKSASAATAALGCMQYIMYLFGISAPFARFDVVGGILILLVLSWLVSGGIRRSNLANAAIVLVTLSGLFALVVGGWYVSGPPADVVMESFSDFRVNDILFASALMFVAYTGYGRIATLGEEVINPSKTIPRAIILSMVVIVVLYLLVASTALHIMGAPAFAETIAARTAPLVVVSDSINLPALGLLVSIAAITAMLGVLLNLILGLSRVLLGMARRKDMPGYLDKIHANSQSPVAAVWTTGAIIVALIAIGDLRLTWSFSAFTVLIYYAITNLASLRLSVEKRLYPRWVSWAGLAGCLGLAFWIDPWVILGGSVCVALGLIYKYLYNR